MSERKVAAVLLAAGASTRLGQPKQLLRLHGESLLRRTARLALEAGCSPVLVILGHAAETMRPELDGLPVRILLNDAWAEGMGSSLRCGVAAAGETQPHGTLLLVCDQPRLTVEHLRMLLECHAAGHAAITASLYARRIGVPAVFAAGLCPELVTLSGDQGAREVIRKHPAEVTAIPFPEGELDIDRPEDLRLLP